MFRGRRRNTGVMEAASTPRCVMCGTDVGVNAAGFCPLGHFVGTPTGAAEPAMAATQTWRAAPEPGAVFTEPTVELPVVDDEAPTASFAPVEPFPVAAPAPVEPAAFGPAVAEPEYAGIVYDQAYADTAESSVDDAYVPGTFGEEQYGFQPAAAETTLPTFEVTDGESEAQHALSELLAFTGSFSGGDETEGFSALDVDPSDLPAHQSFEDAGDAYEPLPSPDDEADETVEARRRAAGLLGGGLLTLLAFVGSIAILPPL